MEFDGDVWMLTVTGHIKPAHAERIIADPVQYQRFLEWYAAELNLTEHVLWIIGKQLDEREGLFPKRRAPLGMRRLGQGETVIYLPDKSAGLRGMTAPKPTAPLSVFGDHGHCIGSLMLRIRSVNYFTFEWRKLCQAYLAEMGDANAYRMDWNRHRGRDWLDLVDRRDF
jgi:hypothetical protein